MHTTEWMFLIASLGNLTLGVLSIARGRKSPVSLPLALLCFDMFGFCFAPLARRVASSEVFSYIDAITTAMAGPLALHFVVTFVGARRSFGRAVVLAYAAFGALALSSAVGFGTQWGRAWLDSPVWHEVFLGVWAPTLATIMFLLVRHLVRDADPGEKARTRIILAAIAVGSAAATVDELAEVGFHLPKIAPVGALLATLLVSLAAFRFRFFDRDLSLSTAIYTASLALVSLVSYLTVFTLLGGNVAALALATVTVTVLVAAAVREVVSSFAAQRARASELATLGRFSNQMAHDLKNPLATIKGALQFLKEERAQGRSLDLQHEFLDVMLGEVDRMHRVVDDYQRVGRVQPVLRVVDVNEVVRGAIALEPFATNGTVTIESALEKDLPTCQLDADLVSQAIQNVIHNAFEAMPDGGRVMVRTERTDAPEGVALIITDAGHGMDARKAERAFDEFYTTKPEGTGLGLAFVRRVAQAHRGSVSLESKVGKGTVVRIQLPSA
jgi:two-component system sensor histidine kinase HydH